VARDFEPISLLARLPNLLFVNLCASTDRPVRERRYIGKPVHRLEDAPLLQGRGRFIDDLNFPDTLHSDFPAIQKIATIHSVRVRPGNLG
jgi:hypothetical protein